VKVSAPLYPIALKVEDLPCLVVGAGRVAARKAASLLECGARVTVIAPQVCAEIESLGVSVARRPYEPGDAASYRLVVTATGVAEVDRAVFQDAEKAGVLVNAADNPEACRFLLPSVLRRGPVSIAVSTAGASPYLAAWLRRRVGELVGPEFAAVAVLLAGARQALKDAGLSSESADWSQILDEDLVSLIADGRLDEADARVNAWLGDQLTGSYGRVQPLDSEPPATASALE
jgi:siroheme synthase-like protein